MPYARGEGDVAYDETAKAGYVETDRHMGAERAASGADLAFEEQVAANTRLEQLVSQLRERLDSVLLPGIPVGEDGLAVARERRSEHTERLRTQAERTMSQADVIERILDRLDV